MKGICAQIHSSIQALPPLQQWWNWQMYENVNLAKMSQPDEAHQSWPSSSNWNGSCAHLAPPVDAPMTYHRYSRRCCSVVPTMSQLSLHPCQGPSHGGSYMDKGTFHIRIGLPPHIVSGDYPASSSPSMLPLLLARACPMSDVRDLGVVLICLTYLVIMCVGTCLHGILYPMTGCVLYLDRLLCWWHSLGLLMFPRLPYDSNTNSYCTWFAVL